MNEDSRTSTTMADIHDIVDDKEWDEQNEEEDGSDDDDDDFELEEDDMDDEDSDDDVMLSTLKNTKKKSKVDGKDAQKLSALSVRKKRIHKRGGHTKQEKDDEALARKLQEEEDDLMLEEEEKERLDKTISNVMNRQAKPSHGNKRKYAIDDSSNNDDAPQQSEPEITLPRVKIEKGLLTTEEDKTTEETPNGIPPIDKIEGMLCLIHTLLSGDATGLEREEALKNLEMMTEWLDGDLSDNEQKKLASRLAQKTLLELSCPLRMFLLIKKHMSDFQLVSLLSHLAAKSLQWDAEDGDMQTLIERQLTINGQYQNLVQVILRFCRKHESDWLASLQHVRDVLYCCSVCVEHMSEDNSLAWAPLVGKGLLKYISDKEEVEPFGGDFVAALIKKVPSDRLVATSLVTSLFPIIQSSEVSAEVKDKYSKFIRQIVTVKR